jgi:hypothetical protein
VQKFASAPSSADNVLEDMSKADLVKMARTALSGAPCLWHPHLCTVESVLVWHPRRRVHADKVIEDASKAQMAKDARKELWLPLEGGAPPHIAQKRKLSYAVRTTVSVHARTLDVERLRPGAV